MADTRKEQLLDQIVNAQDPEELELVKAKLRMLNDLNE